LSNMDLWKRAFTTDPRAVKPITGKPYKGNSPKPYWLIERATQEFGPIGIGWGVTVKSERFERVSETDTLHVAVVSVWYVLDGIRSETFDQMGGTKAAYMSKNGLIVDEDAGKKSVTDGMVKCLSMLGFAGDIFSGMWDDSKYVQWAGEEWDRRYAEADESPEDRAAREAKEKRDAELTDIAMHMIDCEKTGKQMEAIRLWYASDTWNADHITANEERLHIWGLLKNESKLRSAIKANKPAE
jgi:hypothetical protein